MSSMLLDIEKAVRQWAWNEYADTENRKQKKLRKKEENNPNMYVGILINWEDVIFRDETKWPRINPETFDDVNKNSEIAANGGAKTSEKPAVPDEPELSLGAMKLVDPSQRPDHGRTHTSVLFQTKFTNNTEYDQEYTMRTDKTTTSTCSTEIENGWSKSFELGVTLKTPCEVFEANAGYSREVSLTKTQGETFEEELTWGVESQIHVKANHVAEAQLVVDEKKYAGDFVINTLISGMVYVSFTNIRDNNSILKATGDEIHKIVSWFIQRENRKGRRYDDFVKVDEEAESVIVKTKGKCRFRFGIQQEVVVHQVPIKTK